MPVLEPFPRIQNAHANVLCMRKSPPRDESRATCEPVPRGALAHLRIAGFRSYPVARRETMGGESLAGFASEHVKTGGDKTARRSISIQTKSGLRTGVETGAG